MNKKKEMLFGIITLMLCVLLFFQRLTGAICHGVLGMVLVVMIVVHVCRQIGKLKYMKGSVQLVDKMLLTALAVTALSGILLHPLQEMLAIVILHKLSSILFVVATIVHVVQHRKMRKISIK